MVVSGFVICLIIMTLMNWNSPWFIAVYTTLSVLTFIIYALDKQAAKKGQWRTQERTLHLLSLLGGWPGAWLAQSVLRHKSVKVKFRRVYWLTVLVNLSGFIWLQSAQGREWVNIVVQLVHKLTLS